MVKAFQQKFDKSDLSSGITALYSNIVIDQIGSGLVGIFMPVFLWQIFGKLEWVLVYYFCLYFLYLIFMFWGAKVMSVLGQKTSMILSIPFKVLFYASLYYLSLGYPVLIFVILMLICIELRMQLFWIPYHTDFAKFTNKKSRGQVISFFSSISSIVSIFIPFFAGWVIDKHGFETLFLLALVLIATSIVPLFMVRPTYEKFTYSFKKTWHKLFSKSYRRIFGSYLADGVENSIGVIIWPIFIFQLLEGDFLAVGAVSSAIVLVTVVVRMLMGKLTDKYNKKKLLKIGSYLYALGWFVKIFVATGFQIFIASTYHNFAGIVMRTPFSALIYEKAADAGHYVDEQSVLREMSLNMGRSIGIILLLVLVSFVGLQWTFVLAAVASLFINLL